MAGIRVLVTITVVLALPGAGRLRGQGAEPGEACMRPPFAAARELETRRAAAIECEAVPSYRPGCLIDVSLAITEVRPAGGACPAAASATIVERLPPGWRASRVTGGTFSGGKVIWNLTAPFPALLTYRVHADEALARAVFAGTIAEPGTGLEHAVGGEAELVDPLAFSEQGFIRDWLLLGPYLLPPGSPANPGLEAIRADHLTDGVFYTEKNIEPHIHDQVPTAFAPGGPARSVGLAPPATPGACSEAAVPTWREWRDRDDTIDFADFYGGDLDGVMMYAVTHFETEYDLPVDIGLASSDSVQVLLDGEEIWIHDVAREVGPENVVQDVIALGTEPFGLWPGHHRLMVKVFEGSGGHAFRLRLQDPATGEPVTEGIRVCMEAYCGPVNAPSFRRGDADGRPPVEITDAIFVLNWLFAGSKAPLCHDAADADDSGGISIVDSIYLLNWLFSGGRPLPSPGPHVPGIDPTNDALPACIYLDDC
jgi:hypothetical protein